MLDNEPDDPQKDQMRFEQFFEDEILDEPLCPEDADGVGEQLAELQTSVRLLFTRALRQYRGTTWISNYLWNAHLLLEQTWDVLQSVYDHDGFDKPKVPQPWTGTGNGAHTP